MTITDKTRKLLWAGSGKRCAFCKGSLVIEKTQLDQHAIVGEECHIISGSSDGPRFDPNFKESVDDISNLLLLCSVHHKMVDDQPNSYTPEKLRKIKNDHEKWVESKLKNGEPFKLPEVHLKRSEIPRSLKKINDCKELLGLVAKSDAFYHQYSDDLSKDEVELVGSFLQMVTDWGDFSRDMEPLERVRSEFEIKESFKELDRNGFLVFAALERQVLEKDNKIASDFYALHIAIVRRGDENIQTK
ncbi:MAG TPA: HNH endonuclease [Acidobacteriota bacterium]|nr:HNH endonuclease [Acidobacteriota bacterium]